MKENYAGVYGWDNACYWAIAERKAHVDLREFYKKRSDAEFYLEAWKELIDNPETQKHWAGIVTFDPLGMYGTPPTIACCEARLDLPDFQDMTRDGVIVEADGGVKVSKAAVYYSWNLPHMAERLGLGEQELREALYKYSGQEKLLDPNVKTFLPAVGGFTIYAFGDVRKVRDPNTEIAVRVHDECIGSDVFGSDICTCRPYLIFALRHAIECAQRGGVGLVIYYRKEGRSLGEVIKFRVYNARTNQAGGDRPEMYFHHTEAIAGIRDARFQTMMPDALLWMGISRIDWLLSMSNDKFEAIADAGITVMQRVDLPDANVPKAAWVELDAKVASGYHCDAVVEKDTIRERMLQLPMIREQCNRIYNLALKGHLSHIVLDESKISAAVDYVAAVVRETYPTLEIPMHSRMRHFKPSILTKKGDAWPADAVERCRRLVDLCTVSVLLDAGAGPKWKYVCPWDGTVSNRSEGLAQASLDMFGDGCFSSDPALKCRVNSVGLANLKLDTLKRGFQVHGENIVTGLEGRLGLLHRLGEALEENPDFFGPMEVFRPGNVVDYVLKHMDAHKKTVSVNVLWNALIKGYLNIWPANTNTALRKGDMWVHSKIKNPSVPGSDLVPFHKLTQWLCYSLIEVMETGLNIKFTDVDQMTALAEYRNGGLLVDLGVLRLRDPRMQTFGVHVGSELVVEWRALTVVLMDRIANDLREKLKRPDLPLSSILEGGTWRAGRKIAYSMRPDGSPPIVVDSDGTVF